MFLCEDCYSDGWAWMIYPVSTGPCENCGKRKSCVDVPHNQVDGSKLRSTEGSKNA